MRSKSLLVTSVLVLALVLTACGGAASPARTLTVTGTGTITLPPDIAYVYIGVHTENADIAQAVASNNAQAQAVVEALENSGIAAKDLQTSNFSVYSMTQTDQFTGKPTGTNYSVDNTVFVTVRDLGKLASFLDAAIRAGANNINSISFDLADNASGIENVVIAMSKSISNASLVAIN